MTRGLIGYLLVNREAWEDYYSVCCFLIDFVGNPNFFKKGRRYSLTLETARSEGRDVLGFCSHLFESKAEFLAGKGKGKWLVLVEGGPLALRQVKGVLKVFLGLLQESGFLCSSDIFLFSGQHYLELILVLLFLWWKLG